MHKVGRHFNDRDRTKQLTEHTNKVNKHKRELELSKSLRKEVDINAGGSSRYRIKSDQIKATYYNGKTETSDQTDFSYRVDKVTKIVDGDTIDVMLDLGFDIKYKSRVRLFGIDTPESRTRDKVEKKYGLLSKKFLQEQIKKSKKVTIKTYKGDETGKFGRILGDVFLDGKSVNSLMCTKGHAVEYYGQSKDDVEAAHLSNRKRHKV